MLWTTNMQKKFSNMSIQGNALGAARRDFWYFCRGLAPQLLDAAYESGTLHLITAAPDKKTIPNASPWSQSSKKPGSIWALSSAGWVIACISTPL